MPPSNDESPRSGSRSAVIAAGVVLLVGVAMAAVMHLLTRDTKVNEAETQRRHQEAVNHPLPRRAEAARIDTTPLYNPGAGSTPDDVNNASDGNIQEEVIRKEKEPDEADVYAGLAEQARPFRKDRIAEKRRLADHPEDDDSSRARTHEETDALEKNDLFTQ